MIEQVLNLALSVILLCLDLGFIERIRLNHGRRYCLDYIGCFGYVNLYELGREYEGALINLNLPIRLNYKHMLNVELRDIIKERVQHQNKLYKSSFKYSQRMLFQS